MGAHARHSAEVPGWRRENRGDRRRSIYSLSPIFGIVFVTIECEADAIDFYAFADRTVRRLGRLRFRVSRYLSLGELAVDWHARRAPW